MQSANVDRDEWGFTDADHVELLALMQRHTDRVPEMMASLMECGVQSEPDPTALMGAGTMLISSDGTARMFPPGGLWWALLEGLRELDAEGRARR
jgi:hypothetical protein